MIELHLVLKPPPNKTRTLIAALQTLAKSARVEPGCICICYEEIWESEAALRGMIASRHFSQLASLMELASEPPACEFRFIAQTYGLGFAEQVRDYAND